MIVNYNISEYFFFSSTKFPKQTIHTIQFPHVWPSASMIRKSCYQNRFISFMWSDNRHFTIFSLFQNRLRTI